MDEAVAYLLKTMKAALEDGELFKGTKPTHVSLRVKVQDVEDLAPSTLEMELSL